MYVALGRDDLAIEQVLTLLPPELLRPSTRTQPHGKGGRRNGHSVSKDSEGVDQTLGSGVSPVRLAACCCPIPGDAIVGVLSPNKGMFVHRSDCPRLRRTRSNPAPPVELNWLQIEPEFYLAPVTIVAHDRAGLLRDVAAVVADAGVNMTSVTSTTNTSSQKAVITATLEIMAEDGVIDQIERILRRLRQVKNVVSVERTLHIR